MSNQTNGRSNMFGIVIAGISIIIGAIAKGVNDYMVENESCRVYDYNDAVESILKSSMFSTDKKRAIEILKRNENSEYYKTMVSIAKSNMFSCSKLELMKTIGSRNE